MSKIFTAIFVLCMLSAFNCARLQRSKSTNTTNVTMSKFDEVADVMIANLTHFIHTNSSSENATQILESVDEEYKHLKNVWRHATSEEEKDHMESALKHIDSLENEIRTGETTKRSIRGGKGGKRGPKRGDDKEHGNSTRTNRSMPRQNETGPSDEDLDINIEQ